MMLLRKYASFVHGNCSGVRSRNRNYTQGKKLTLESGVATHDNLRSSGAGWRLYNSDIPLGASFDFVGQKEPSHLR
jgi:hypothetical protein